MAKRNRDPRKIAEAIESIKAKYGADKLKTADEEEPIEFMSTGLPEVDRMLGGGLAKGRISMVVGPEGAGKTSFALFMLSKFQNEPVTKGEEELPYRAVYINAERAFDRERAKTFQIDRKKVLIFDNDTAEQALSAVIKFADAGIPLIILDSVASLVPQKEFELEDNTEKVAGMALIAGLLSRKVFAINNLCYNNNVTILFINQERENIGAFAFGPQTHIPGGRALKHVTHVIFKVARKENIKVSDEVLGMICKFSTNIKNRSAAPFQDAEVPLLFDTGFEHLETYKEKVKEIRKQHLKDKHTTQREAFHDER